MAESKIKTGKAGVTSWVEALLPATNADSLYFDPYAQDIQETVLL